jgi:hypothetical protein
MTTEEQAFHRDFSKAAMDIARLYSAAYTAMEAEMGSETAPLLAPHILQTIVASAQEVAFESASERARLAFEQSLYKPQAEAVVEAQGLISLAQVLQQGRPW